MNTEPLNAAGLCVAGPRNPRWAGGLIDKTCEICGICYQVKRVHSKSRFCSLQCVGISQRGNPRPRRLCRRTTLTCLACGNTFSVPQSHAHKYRCCSKSCSFQRRSVLSSGAGNTNWNGGISGAPYLWNWKKISKRVISRDGGRCLNPACDRKDKRLTAHHINYDKLDCTESNLITLCSSCNSRANFSRERWQRFYSELMAKKRGGGWTYEEF